jgi:hypothetical protein
VEPTAQVPTGGTALIVVPGVGDDAQGDTVGAMTGALLSGLGPGAHATPFTRSIVVPPLPGSAAAPVVHEMRCARIDRPGVAAPLIVYEMHWADLSRFPGTLRRFVLTLYGLLFQISTVGIEAFRALPPHRLPQRVIRVFSYLTAVLVLGLTAGAAILGVEFAAMVRLDERPQQVAVAGAVLLLMIVLAWFGDRFLRGHGWRFSATPLGRPGLAFAIVAAGVGVVPLVLHAQDPPGSDLAVAVHEVLWFSVRWVLPAAWVLVGVTALTIAAILLWTTLIREDRGGAYRANRTAVLSVVVGGLGIALLGALLVAAGLALTAQATGAATPVPPQAALDAGADTATFGAYAGAVFDRSLRPLAVALTCTLTLLVVILVAGFPYVSALAQAGWRSARPRLEAAETAVSVALPALLVPALLGAGSPVADAVAIALTLLALGALVAYWVGRFGPDPRRRPLGRGFDRLLGWFGSAAHACLLGLALLVSALALGLATPLTPGPSEWLGGLSETLFDPLTALASGSGLDSALKVSATVVALLGLAALVRTRLSALAKALDVAYDVATYVRVPHGAPDRAPVEPPRRRVLRRYAAILSHVDAMQAPSSIVIAAHSQGSMYSLALMFGDEFRDRADRQEVVGWPLAPRLLPDHPDIAREPAPRLRAPISLLTAGCPILQTYAPSFPGQYEWPADRGAVNRQLATIGPRTTWRNAYRSGDYLGRALWSSRECALHAPWGALSEVCIGPGHHTGYWGDPRFAAQVLALV